MAYDDAAVFLARALPWPPLLANQPEWFVNIHAPWRLPNGKLAYGGRACTSVNDAINFIEWKLSDPKQAGDLYVCMSGQRVAKAKTDKAGRTYWTAVRGVHNALWHKGFYIDIDVKEGGYSDSGSALKALAAFIHAADLPFPSFIVASGSGGFHVHWTLADPISTEVWQPLAQALVTAMRHHGFIVDYACTTDAARLLRVPGTKNYKHNPPKPVDLKHGDGTEYTLSRIEDVLLTYKSMTVPSPVRRQNMSNGHVETFPLGKLAANAPPFVELVANQQDNLPTLTQLADCCPFVEQAVLTGGKDYRQPLWWETAKLAFYTRRGVDALHDMSKLHHQYTPKETDELWARIERERTPTDLFGWPHCETIENAGARECGSCQWKINGRTVGKSPLHFIGEKWREPLQLQAPVTVPSLDQPFGLVPSRYYFDDIGRIWMNRKDDEDEDELVMPHPTRLYDVTYNPWGLQFEANTDQHGWRPVTIRSKDFEPRTMARVLGDQGLPLNPTHARLMGYLLPSFTELLREHAKHSVPVEASGWSWIDGKPTAFVYGKTRYNCEGDRPATMLDVNLQRMYSPTGSPEPWRAAIKMTTDQHRPELQVIVAAAFGAPLMEFTGESGLILCARSSESGIQKTSAMKVGCAVWGNPKEAMQQTSDTLNSVIQKAGTVKNIPLWWDEINPQRQGPAIMDFLNQMAGGRSRGRLNRDSTQQWVGTWSTLLVCTTNKTLRGLADERGKETNASLYRVLEYNVARPKDGLWRHDNAQSLLSNLTNNYGHAGAVYGKYLGMHPTELQTRTENAQKYVRERFNATEAERFWVAGVAVILLGAKLANELKLAEFDLDLMADFLEQVFMENRRHVEGSDAGFHKSVNVTNVIAGFCNDPRHFVLRVEAVAQGKGKPSYTSSNAVELRGIVDVCARVSTDPAIVQLSSRVLHEYCRRHEYPAEVLVDELKKRFGAKRVKLTLTAGTPIKRAQEYVYEMDRNHPDLKDLFS